MISTSRSCSKLVWVQSDHPLGLGANDRWGSQVFIGSSRWSEDWLMVDGWLMVDDDWWLMIDDWWLMIDDWWLMVDGWWLMMDDGWLMVDDGWWVFDGLWCCWWWISEIAVTKISLPTEKFQGPLSSRTPEKAEAVGVLSDVAVTQQNDQHALCSRKYDTTYYIYMHIYIYIIYILSISYISLFVKKSVDTILCFGFPFPTTKRLLNFAEFAMRNQSKSVQTAVGSPESVLAWSQENFGAPCRGPGPPGLWKVPDPEETVHGSRPWKTRWIAYCTPLKTKMKSEKYPEIKETENWSSTPSFFGSTLVFGGDSLVGHLICEGFLTEFVFPAMGRSPDRKKRTGLLLPLKSSTLYQL